MTVIHGDDKIKLKRQSAKYRLLKEKFLKLKDDHKSLLGNSCLLKRFDLIAHLNRSHLILSKTDLATRLVGALEESLQGESKCSVEAFENYNQQIMTYSQSLEKVQHISNSL